VTRTSLIAAAAIILTANGFALLHAARNRAGAPDAEIVLSDRELSLYRSGNVDEDSGVSLDLQWSGSYWPVAGEDGPMWLDQEQLRALGFDVSVNANASEAGQFYDRQRARQSYIALEQNGPAWQVLSDAYARAAEEQKARGIPIRPDNDMRTHASRLVAIDADLDPARLRSRHPDRHGVVIMPGVVAVGTQGFRPAHLQGYVRELPTSIHVALPLSEEFRKRASTNSKSYQVQLSFGAMHEPWVTGVQFGN
jgi:hypothetical protein